MADANDAAKWARARTIAAEEQETEEEYREYKRGLALRDRFRSAAAADVIRMFETGTNEKGEPLSQFERGAMREMVHSLRRAAAFRAA
jgi:hypothetical protein